MIRVLFGEHIIRRKRMGSLEGFFFQIGMVQIPFLFLEYLSLKS